MIKTIADTILWLSKERMKTEPFQNLNSAIHATNLEVSLHLINNYMKENKNETSRIYGSSNKSPQKK